MREPQKILLAHVATTYGAENSPIAAATDAVLTQGLQVSEPYGGNVVSRDFDKATLGASESINTGPRQRMTFGVEIAGAGTAGAVPAWNAVMRGCGFAVADSGSPATAQVYTPISSSFPSLNMYVYRAGQLHKMLGARGNMNLSLSAGQLPLFQFDYTGLYTRPSQAAGTANVTDFTAPVAVTNDNTTTFTVGGTSYKVESFNLNMNNNVVHRNIVNSNTVTITNRNVTGTMVIEAPEVTDSPWNNVFASVESDSGVTTAALAITHGTTAGNIVSLAAPQMQFVNIQEGNSDDVLTYTIDFVLVPTSAGNDELTITVA
jgi:hypothetical protein